jgi:hypothetical protein
VKLFPHANNKVEGEGSQHHGRRRYHRCRRLHADPGNARKRRAVAGGEQGNKATTDTLACYSRLESEYCTESCIARIYSWCRVQVCTESQYCTRQYCTELRCQSIAQSQNITQSHSIAQSHSVCTELRGVTLTSDHRATVLHRAERCALPESTVVLQGSQYCTRVRTLFRVTVQSQECAQGVRVCFRLRGYYSESQYCTSQNIAQVRVCTGQSFSKSP